MNSSNNNLLLNLKYPTMYFMKISKKLLLISSLFLLQEYIFSQSNSLAREIRNINDKIANQSIKTDSLDAQISLLLPELQNALKANLKAKEQTDSVAIVLINRINTIQNKMRLIEDKAAYIDSVNFEILAQLVMIENKIVTLTNSFTEIYTLKNVKPSKSNPSSISPEQYKKNYIDALSFYQNGEYDKAVTLFSKLVQTDSSNDLADNSQYWLAECYYTMKNYKRAVSEFTKVFSFPATDKDDDAQLKLGHCYRSMGNTKKAIEEYQRLVDYFPGSEFYNKALESIKQLNI